MPMDVERIVEQMIGAWNTDDPDARRRLIESTCTEATEVTSPYGEHRGIDAQLEMIAQARSQFPQLRCTAKVLAHHHGWVMDSWTTDFGEGCAPLHGIDVSLLNDAGKVVKVLSFSPIPPV
ncbi:MAG: nuclear transport factor 2 family protein [Thermoplasmata archaeon]